MSTVNPAPRFITHVFLGGTVDSTYRDRFTEAIGKCELSIKPEIFNPIVPDWTPEHMILEMEAKERSEIQVFAITPAHTGFFTFIEIMDAAIKHPNKKVFVTFLTDEGEWTDAQKKSNWAILNVLRGYKNVLATTGDVTALAGNVAFALNQQFGTRD